MFEHMTDGRLSLEVVQAEAYKHWEKGLLSSIPSNGVEILDKHSVEYEFK